MAPTLLKAHIQAHVIRRSPQEDGGGGNDQSQSTNDPTNGIVTAPSVNIAGFAAAIAILSSIIIGYILYRIWARYRTKHTSPGSASFREKKRKDGAIGQWMVAGDDYDHFPALSKSKSKKEGGVVLLPEAPPTPMPEAGWGRPPTLTPWAQSRPSSSSDDYQQQLSSPPLPTMPALPAQAKTNPKNKRGLKAFWGEKGHDSMDASLVVQTPPPEYGRFTHHGTPPLDFTPMAPSEKGGKEKPAATQPPSQLRLVVACATPSPTSDSHPATAMTRRSTIEIVAQPEKAHVVESSSVVSPRRVSSLSHPSWSQPPPSPNLPPPVPPVPAHFQTNPPNSSSAIASTSIPTPATTTATTGATSSNNLPRLMSVTTPFTPSLSDELPIELGEILTLHEEYVDGWCCVNRFGGSDDDTRGVVPRFCLSEFEFSPGKEMEMNFRDTLVVPKASTSANASAGTSGSANPRISSKPSPISISKPKTKTSGNGNGDGNGDIAVVHSSKEELEAPLDSKGSRFSSWGSEPEEGYRPLSPAIASSGHPSRAYSMLPGTPGFPTNQDSSTIPAVPPLPQVDTTNNKRSYLEPKLSGSYESESSFNRPPPAPRVSRFQESSQDSPISPPAQERMTMPPLNRNGSAGSGRTANGGTPSPIRAAGGGMMLPSNLVVGIKRFTGGKSGGVITPTSIKEMRATSIRTARNGSLKAKA